GAGPAERAWRWCRRNPALAGLMAAVATLLVAVAAGATAAALQYRLMAGTEVRLRNEAQGRAESETQARQELESSLYFHLIALADRELSENNLGRALKLLGECPERLRGWEWHYLNRLCKFDTVILRNKAEV